jgi:RNA polymerase sigma-70 factor (ECF subfamily)
MSKGKTDSSESQREDFWLIRNFLIHDMRAFDQLVTKYRDKVFNLCFHILGDFDEADDCAQEIFIKVYNNLKKFRFKSSFPTWLYRIAVNTCRNRISSLHSRINRTALRIGISPDSVSDHMDILDSSYEPGALLEKSEQMNNVHKAIESLPENLRILVILRDIEGKSYEDISSITGTNLGTVKSRLVRARHQLREKLRGVV